jgi:hypothetical protein
MKRYKNSGTKLTIVVKNKRASGWTKAWFYCRVPSWRKECLCPALPYERCGLSDKASD